MLCQLRTLGAGIGVLAICFMLASLSWQFLLLGFALASIAWAFWSCSRQLRSHRRPTELPPPVAFRRRQPPATADEAANVYDFPAQQWGGKSILN